MQIFLHGYTSYSLKLTVWIPDFPFTTYDTEQKCCDMSKHFGLLQMNTRFEIPVLMREPHLHSHVPNLSISFHNLSRIVYTNSAQIFHKPRNHLTILGNKRVTLGKFHIEDPQILGNTVQNLVASQPGIKDICAVP
jgi:hypothetical protein